MRNAPRTSLSSPLGVHRLAGNPPDHAATVPRLCLGLLFKIYLGGALLFDKFSVCRKREGSSGIGSWSSADDIHPLSVVWTLAYATFNLFLFNSFSFLKY
jgi:hypothetical protein